MNSLSMKEIVIAPSVLSADFANLQRDVEMLNRSQADWIHVDIMDGVFVPNISFGLPVCKSIYRHARKPLDVHLMIHQPDNYLEAFRDAGADRLTVHLESCPHLHRTISRIKELGCKAGVALNPHTPVSMLEDIIQDIDLVLMMSVNPGFGGQKFIENTYNKLQKLAQLMQQEGVSCWVEVDGGVNSGNAARLVQYGASALVTGSFVFSSENPETTISELKSLQKVSLNE
jgi:ribulose-phosphate 3-epimerase